MAVYFGKELRMGIYLDGSTAYTLYKSESVKPYFVDKTRMPESLFPFVDEGNNHICITRPRRFGKTVMANMIAAFSAKDRTAMIFLISCGSRNRRSIADI